MEKRQEEKLKELQILEQNLQNIIIQKQTYLLEMTDINNALEELSKQKDDVYKIVGSLMVKTKKEEVEKELKQKKEITEIRIKNLDKQEQIFNEKSLKMREELMDEFRSMKK